MLQNYCKIIKKIKPAKPSSIMWSWGSGASGVLGHNDYEDLHSPTRIGTQFPYAQRTKIKKNPLYLPTLTHTDRIVNVACGGNHCLAVDGAGVVIVSCCRRETKLLDIG